MKKTIMVFVLLIFLSCKTKNEFEGQFLSAIEVSTLNRDGTLVNFNVGYTVKFEQSQNQDCIVDSKEELNSMVIEPTIRSVIRSYVGQMDDDEIELIDKEVVKAKINEELLGIDISINTKKLVDCPFKVSMFAITKRN